MSIPSPSLYEPLSSFAATRLFILPPSASEDDVTGHLLEVDLVDECLPYEAVSYVWGTVAESHLIVVNDQIVPVRRNLYDCLRRLRSLTDARVLWIDALSISQRDVEEKTRQVAMIGTIFKAAERVLAWLGEHADCSEYLFDQDGWIKFHKDPRAKDLVLDITASAWPPERHHFDSRSEQPSIKNEISVRVAVWSAFAQRAYFSRLWVVQEVCLARELFVCCRDSHGAWEDIIAFRAESMNCHNFLTEHGGMWDWNLKVEVAASGSVWQFVSKTIGKPKLTPNARDRQRTQ